MGKQSQNTAQVESRLSEPQVRENEPTVRKGEPERARKLLANSSIPAKTWAVDLEVTERVVQAWASGSKDIPPLRVQQIFHKASGLLQRQRESIDKFISELLENAYGPNDKEGM